MKNVKIIMAICLALFLAGCGSTPNYYLAPAATQNISSSDVYITIAQKEISAEIDQSNVAAAGGGGLLLALIDVAVENSRAKDAEARIQPIKDGLVDIDFTELFSEALKQELAAITWLNVENVIVNTDLTENQSVDNYDASKADTVLFVNTSYSIASNFNLLKAQSGLTLYPKNNGLKQYSEKGDSKQAKKNPLHLDNVVYRDNVLVTSGTLGAGTDVDVNAKKLVESMDKVQEEFKSIASKLAKAVATSVLQTRQPAA